MISQVRLPFTAITCNGVAYDGLLGELDAVGVRPYWILDYGNPLYDNGTAPSTEIGIDAFARFAVASVSHYEGRGVVWELWNEPNLPYSWHPWPNATAYAALALSVGAAVKSTYPHEILIAPASGEIDLVYLEKIFSHGVLEYFDAVSIHAYRHANPETVVPDLARVRALIDLYAPEGRRNISLISGEWGYTTCAPWCTGVFVSDDVQARYLARMWLTNTISNIPMSTWYDWHDDGDDILYAQHNFGTTFYPYYNETHPYAPKPSYVTATVMSGLLSPGNFAAMLPAESANNPTAEIFAPSFFGKPELLW